MGLRHFDQAGICQRIDAARKRQGLTVTALWKKLLQEAGDVDATVTYESVRRYCRGEQWPVANPRTFVMLAQILNESPLWLLFAVKEPLHLASPLELTEPEAHFVESCRQMPPPLQAAALEASLKFIEIIRLHDATQWRGGKTQREDATPRRAAKRST